MTLGVLAHTCPAGEYCGQCAHNVKLGGRANHPSNLVRAGKAAAPPRKPPRGPCPQLGADTGRRVGCPTCTGKVELKVLGCSVHGACTVGKAAPGLACCATCPDHPEA